MASEHQVPQRVQRTPSSQEQREGGGCGVWRTGSQKKAVSVSVSFCYQFAWGFGSRVCLGLARVTLPALDGYGVGANKAKLERVDKGFRGRGKEGGGRELGMCAGRIWVLPNTTPHNPPPPFPLPPLQDKNPRSNGGHSRYMHTFVQGKTRGGDKLHHTRSEQHLVPPHTTATNTRTPSGSLEQGTDGAKRAILATNALC